MKPKGIATGILALIAYLGLAVGLQVLVMIHGWGLEPKSWWWIVGVGVIGMTIAHTLGRRVLKELED